jgi:hypothetical protein
MRWWSLVWCLVVWSVLPVVGGIWAQSIGATPEEAISKVREAAALIAVPKSARDARHGAVQRQ